MNFLKWFFVIFFAVFFANIASNFATAGITLLGTKALFESLGFSGGNQSSVRIANPLKSGQSREEALCASWQTLYRNDPKTPFRLQMEQACKAVYGDDWVDDQPVQPVVTEQPVSRDDVLKQRALENDLRICRSWIKIYNKQPTEEYRGHLNSSCKRAYGNQWIER